MSINIFPVATTSTATSKFVTAPVSYTGYKSAESFSPGVYTITTSPNSYQAYISFWSGGTKIVSATTISGTVTVNLSSSADTVYYYTTGGTDVVIGFSLTGTNLTRTAPSGTVDTITTSGTYSQTGLVYAIALGGGASGGAGATYNSGYYATTSGGSTGSIAEGWITLSSSTTVTIGAGGLGVGAATYSNPGSPGGTTSFGTHLIAVGGRGGGNSCCSMSYSEPGSPSVGSSVVDPITTGFSYGIQKPIYGGLGSTSAGEVAGGSGIGLGGQSKGASGTGRASGGAGGTNAVTSGAGAPGVVYVIRNFI